MVREKILEEKLALNVSKIAVLAVSLLVATYAWLSNNTQGNINQMTVSTAAHNEIMISLNGGASWTSTASLNIPSNFEFNSEITGNGINLYHPVTKNSNGSPLTLASAISNHDYYEFDVMFRSNVETRVFLENSSFVSPFVGIAEGDLIGSSVGNRSVVGEFSRDLIAGAVRVAFIDNAYNAGTYSLGSSTSLVWAPNKGYEITEVDEVFTASINSTNTQNYKYINVASGNPSGELLPTNLKDNLNADLDLKQAGGDPHITSVVNESNGYYYSEVTVRIWIEGNDRDALIALKGGKFKISLIFVGVEKVVDNVEPAVTADLELNQLIGFDSSMEYSLDYGNNWITYLDNSNPTFLEGTVVYVRKSETTTNLASIHRTLNY